MILIFLNKQKIEISQNKPTCLYNSDVMLYTEKSLSLLSKQEVQCLCYQRKDLLSKKILRKLGFGENICEDLENLEARFEFIVTVKNMVLPFLTILFDFLYKCKFFLIFKTWRNLKFTKIVTVDLCL